MSSMNELPNWVEYMPNHEMKPVVMYGLLSAGHVVSQIGLSNEINNLQSGLIVFDRRSPQQFCRLSLSPSGFSESHTIEYIDLFKSPATARGDMLTKTGQEHGIAISGDLSAFALRNPKVSLGEVLGKSAPRRSETGVSQVALRYTILNNLVTEGSLAVSDLTDLHSSNSAVSYAVQEMETEGIVEVSRSIINNERTFEIINSDYNSSQRNRPYKNLSTDRKFIFKVLRIAHSVRSTWQLDEFLTLAHAVEDDPELLFKLSKTIQHWLAPSIKQNNIRNVSGPLFNKGDKYSSVKIDKNYLPAIKELIGILGDHINGDSTAMKRGAEHAIKIMESPTDMAELIAKPRRGSAKVNKDPQFKVRLAEIVSSSKDPLNAKSIHNAYEEISGRKVAFHTITMHLWDLVKSNQLRAHLRPATIDKTLAAPLYSAI
jgi:hypothetical protein